MRSLASLKGFMFIAFLISFLFKFCQSTKNTVCYHLKQLSERTTGSRWLEICNPNGANEWYLHVSWMAEWKKVVNLLVSTVVVTEFPKWASQGPDYTRVIKPQGLIFIKKNSSKRRRTEKWVDDKSFPSHCFSTPSCLQNYFSLARFQTCVYIQVPLQHEMNFLVI